MRRVVLVLLLAIPAAARAGRLPFSQVSDVEVVPTRIVELQWWVDERVGTPDRATDDVATVWGAAFGVSPRVELVIATELEYARASDRTSFTWYGGQVRWRLAPPGPPSPRPVVLLQLGVDRYFAEGAVEGQLDAVVASDPVNGLHTVADVGVVGEADGSSAQLRGGLGVVGEAVPGLRLGGEAFAEAPLITSSGWNSGRANPAFAVGPTASFTSGPFWVTAGGLFGLGDRRAYDATFHLAWGVEL
jgi:hypothetical protein